MAKYSKAASEKVADVMREQKEGKLRSGSGKKVTSRKQAIAIALSEARKEGKKVPARDTGAAKAGSKKTAAKKATRKTAAKKTSSKPASKKASTGTKRSAAKKATAARKR